MVKGKDGDCWMVRMGGGDLLRNNIGVGKKKKWKNGLKERRRDVVLWKIRRPGAREKGLITSAGKNLQRKCGFKEQKLMRWGLGAWS